MIEVKFLGKTDFNFTNGNTYKLINITYFDGYELAYLVNAKNKIERIPYKSIYSFNQNWEVV